MEFYVPLGCRGIVFRFGTFLIGVLGGIAYRKAARMRSPAANDPEVSLVLLELLALD